MPRRTWKVYDSYGCELSRFRSFDEAVAHLAPCPVRDCCGLEHVAIEGEEVKVCGGTYIVTERGCNGFLP